MKFWTRVCTLAALCCHAACTFAADYPDKPIRMIVAAPPGGPADYFGRALATGLSQRLGQPVIVDNRGGATGTIGAAAVANAPPDGLTLLMGQSSSMTVAPHLIAKPGYDTLADFQPVIMAASQPMLMVVNPNVPARTVQEFIAYAKARPGKLNFSSIGSGSPSHLTGILFDKATGIEAVHVPYKGAGAGINGLIAGEVQYMFAPIVSVTTQVEGGRLRALAVTSAAPSPGAPGVPTVQEAGKLPGFVASAWFGLFVPAKTPPAIVQRLYAESRAVLDDPEVRTRFMHQGAGTVGSTTEEFERTVREDFSRYGKIIKEENITSD